MSWKKRSDVVERVGGAVGSELQSETVKSLFYITVHSQVCGLRKDSRSVQP